MFEVGELVVSTAGRDAATYYLVTECAGHYAQVCDGVRRALANPKRKNLRHLRSCGKVAAELGQRLQRGDRVSDEEIRAQIEALESYVTVDNDPDED